MPSDAGAIRELASSPYPQALAPWDNPRVYADIIMTDKKQRTAAAKAAAFWAARRTDLRLLEQAKNPHIPDRSRRINQLLEDLEHILESTNIKYPPSLTGYGLTQEMSLKERKIALDIPAHTPNFSHNELEFLEYMENLSSQGRQSEWKWRIANHAEEYQEKGWYPFFVTLTVDPNNHDPEEVWKSGRPLRRYIRRLSKVVTKELGVRPAHKTNTPESEYITYIGVIEHGKSRKHHHAHFLIWMREIPDSWKIDPNLGVNAQHRKNRECVQLRQYWGEPDPETGEMIPYSLPGLSPGLYFRSLGDVWSKLGHTIPLDNNGTPTRIGTARQSGAYIVKYLQKDHKEWKHRVKATRNLGKNTLIAKIRTLTDSQVEAATWRAPSHHQNHSVKMIHSVPLVLLRRLATQEHFYRQYKSNQLDFKTLTKRITGMFQKMLQSVQAGNRPERMPSSEFYDWLSRHLPEQKGYSDDRFWEVHNIMAELYPAQTYRTNHTTIPGNEIGYT